MKYTDIDGASGPVRGHYSSGRRSKVLGSDFHRKLAIVPPTHYLKQWCLKAFNLLRAVAHTDWGAARQLYTVEAVPVACSIEPDCRSIVYGSARALLLQALDRVRNAAVRICLGT
jgi:hypothetical protein